MLLITAIRCADPKVFELVNESINELRGGVDRRDNKNDANDPTRFAQKVDELLRHHLDATAGAIRWALTELFPGWKIGGRGADRARERPQSLAALHTDYWSRLITMQRPEPRKSDQTALALIDEWKSGGKAAEPLVSMLTDEEAPESLENFLSRLTSSELVRLLDEIILEEARRDRRQWDRFDPPSIVSIWRSMLSRPPVKIELHTTLMMRIPALAKKNLSLAFSLIHFFATPDNGVAPLLEPQQQTDLMSALHQVMVEHLAGRPGELVDALRGTPPQTLNYCCWGLARLRNNGAQGEPFMNWNGFAVGLLVALGKDPAVIVPQLLGLLVAQREVFDLDALLGQSATVRFTYDVSGDTIKRLFRIDELAKALAESKLPEFYGEAGEMLVALRSGIAKARAADQTPETARTALPG